MKLFFAPGACSIGIRFLLEEIGKPFDTVRLDFREGDQFKPEYVAINPKSKVPALQREDGSVLTEYPVVALWLARTNPDRNLLPPDLEGEIQTLEMLDYVVSTIHMQGLSRMLRPAKFAMNETDHQTVVSAGREIVVNAYHIVADRLGERPFIMGSNLTIADSALFYTLFWAIDRQKVDLPKNVSAYYARLKSRATAQKCFADEGIVVG